MSDIDIADPVDRSIVEDIHALLNDGRNYAEAELAFQKARLGYAAQRGKSIALFGGLAIFFVFFALMGLVFGAILALAALVGALVATALVVGSLLLLAALSLAMLRKNLRGVRQAFSETEL